MSALAGNSGVGVTGVEYVVNWGVGDWGTWIGASCTDAGCGRFFVLGTGRDDTAVSNIVARYLSAAMWSELEDVVTVAKAVWAHLLTR